MKNDYTPVFLFIIKLTLGISFIYGSYHRIADPEGFAKILYGTAVFPGVCINILAISIPFVGLVAGFSLIMGLFPRSAVLIINATLSGFILIIGFNLLRGHQFDCGYFVFSSENQTASNIYLLITDFLMLASGIYFLRKTTAS